MEINYYKADDSEEYGFHIPEIDHFERGHETFEIAQENARILVESYQLGVWG